ncbi:UNVERIFIED_CONTAM: hypothetical protein HDU68_010963 [Siphonaria sp. JEL0065]|nr:hypothetical protein HDU68_010963 [Siphonaria sp. JEL0065]
MHSLLKSHFGYHQWAYNRLLTLLTEMPYESYRGNSGLCFRSVHGTLNHLLLGDRLWLDRLKGATATPSHASILSYWTQPELYATKESKSIYWEEYIEDRNELEVAIREQCRLFREYIDALEEIPETFQYDRKGEVIVKPFVTTLLHIVNHGTHHRGQITAAMFAAGLAPPSLDLLYYDPSAVVGF